MGSGFYGTRRVLLCAYRALCGRRHRDVLLAFSEGRAALCRPYGARWRCGADGVRWHPVVQRTAYPVSGARNCPVADWPFPAALFKTLTGIAMSRNRKADVLVFLRRDLPHYGRVCSMLLE